MKKILVAIAAAVLVLVSSGIAHAYPWQSYYTGGRWVESVQVHVHYVHEDAAWWHANNDARLTTLGTALAQWNVQGNGPKFATITEWGGDLPCSSMYTDVLVFHAPLPQNYAGNTIDCAPDGDGHIWAGKLTVADPPTAGGTSYTWYSPCNVANPSGTESLCGILTHEVGHVVGQKVHFAATDTACDTTNGWANVNTMCVGSVFGAGESWREFSLAGQDKSTYDSAYP